MKTPKFLILMMMSVALFGCDEDKEARSERIAKIKENTKRCADNPYIYYQLVDKIIPQKRGEFHFARFKGEVVKDRGCMSSLERPLKIDYISFGMPFEIQNYPNEDYPIFGFFIKLGTADTTFYDNRKIYNEILDELEDKGIAMESLDIVDGYYQYKYSERYDLYKYFPVNNRVVDVTGTPITLPHCPNVEWAASCSGAFRWTNEIKVLMNSQHRVELPLSIWDEVYPQTINKLDNLAIRNSDPKKE